jgi:aminomethyltransferase
MGLQDGETGVSNSIHSVANDTIRISSRRFEPSPFQPLWQKPDMLLGVYAGRSYPIDLGDDPSEMYWNLRRRSVMYDVPERPVEISGRMRCHSWKRFSRDI